MEAFLDGFLPRLLPAEVPRKIIDHGSKQQLLRELPRRLSGYARYPIECRPKALVLVDRDADDCRVLKTDLERYAADAGLASKSAPAPDGLFDVVNRVVIEELEAWYFGAVPALTVAYRGVPANLAAQQAYRDPDNVRGGTHEALLQLLKRYGHYRGLEYLPKMDAARRMSKILDPDTNRSGSFGQFLNGLNALLPQL